MAQGENDNELNAEKWLGFGLGTPESSQIKAEAAFLGVMLADAAFLHDAGYLNITSEALRQRHFGNTLLGWHSVEDAFCLNAPYGQAYVEVISRTTSQPPQFKI